MLFGFFVCFYLDLSSCEAAILTNFTDDDDDDDDEVIQISVNSKMANGGHLEFSTLRMFLWNCLLEVEHCMLHAKFGVNRTNRLEVIQILLFLRWRWAAILVFENTISEQ